MAYSGDNRSWKRLLLTGFMGVNLIIFGLTGFRIMANILDKLGAGLTCRGGESNDPPCKVNARGVTIYRIFKMRLSAAERGENERRH